DPGHPSGPAAGADRQAAAGEQAHPAGGVGDRPPVRRHDPGASAGRQGHVTARSELGTLEASGLIQIVALQPELEYLFRHALVQEAAYASLLKQDRRALHHAAAEAIFAQHPDRERELASVLALHFEQAGENARAAKYLVMAGD